jgi:hypothetical protein
LLASVDFDNRNAPVAAGMERRGHPYTRTVYTLERQKFALESEAASPFDPAAFSLSAEITNDIAAARANQSPKIYNPYAASKEDIDKAINRLRKDNYISAYRHRHGTKLFPNASAIDLLLKKKLLKPSADITDYRDLIAHEKRPLDDLPQELVGTFIKGPVSIDYVKALVLLRLFSEDFRHRNMGLDFLQKGMRASDIASSLTTTSCRKFGLELPAALTPDMELIKKMLNTCHKTSPKDIAEAIRQLQDGNYLREIQQGSMKKLLPTAQGLDFLLQKNIIQDSPFTQQYGGSFTTDGKEAPKGQISLQKVEEILYQKLSPQAALRVLQALQDAQQRVWAR